jgi:hypothetical protein
LLPLYYKMANKLTARLMVVTEAYERLSYHVHYVDVADPLILYSRRTSLLSYPNIAGRYLRKSGETWKINVWDYGFREGDVGQRDGIQLGEGGHHSCEVLSREEAVAAQTRVRFGFCSLEEYKTLSGIY